MEQQARDNLRRSVVVTGASSGIGKAIALGLDKAGFFVIAGVRSEEDQRALQDQASGKLRPITMDITCDEHLSAAAAIVEQDLDRTELIGLVNNAGISVTGPLEFISRLAMLHQLDVNTISQLAVIQAFLPFLRRSKGRIVNIGSTSGRIAEPLSGPYCASKFALDAISSALRMELQPSGVRVSIVEPGAVSTGLWNKMIASEDTLLQSMPAEGRIFYEKHLSERRAKLKQLAGAGKSADKIVDAVIHALTSSHPKTRYTIGFDAKARIAVAKVLPQQFRNWLVRVRRRMTGS